MITATVSAATHIREYIDKRGKGIGIRFSTRNAGCTGMAYVIEVADEINNDEVTFVSNGITIISDIKSLAYIDGTEIDFEVNGLNSGLTFKNPHETSRCGCGETFGVD